MTAGRQTGRTALITGAARGQGRAHAVAHYVTGVSLPVDAGMMLI